MKIDKNDARFEIRLPKEQLHLLEILAMQANMTVSEYVRMLIRTATTPIEAKLRNGELTYDNLETVFDNKLQYRQLFKR